MIPSNKWFPSSLQERAAWFNNFATQFDMVAVNMGFTAGDVTAVNADNALVQSVAGIMTEAEAYLAAVRQFRTLVMEGAPGDPTPSFPEVPAYTPPAAVPAGVFTRLDN